VGGRGDWGWKIKLPNPVVNIHTGSLNCFYVPKGVWNLGQDSCWIYPVNSSATVHDDGVQSVTTCCKMVRSMQLAFPGMPSDERVCVWGISIPLHTPETISIWTTVIDINHYFCDRKLSYNDCRTLQSRVSIGVSWWSAQSSFNFDQDGNAIESKNMVCA